MMLRTKTKMLLAGLVQRALMTTRKFRGAGPVVVCQRGQLNWRLDLREGIDFSIYLLGAFEPSTVAAYRRILDDGSVAIDIGANIGAHTLPLAASVGQWGMVIAAEPTQYAYNRLLDQIGLNRNLQSRIHAHQVMLMGRRDVQAPSTLPSSWPFSAVEAAHEHHLGISKETTGTTVMTLDELIKVEGLQKLDLVKLDVDGYEVEVLRGAQNALSDFGPAIIFEHAPYFIEEKGYDPEELVRILRQAGYRFHHLNGKPFAFEGDKAPNIPVGAGINVLAFRR